MNASNLLSLLVPTLTTLFAVCIGAFISGYTWNRQKQWELRRDAIIELMRDISSLRHALLDVYGASFDQGGRFAVPDDPDQQTKLAQFYEHFSRYFCSRFVVDVLTGEDLTHSLDEFQKCVESIINDIKRSNTSASRNVTTQRELAEKTNAVIRAGRKELGMKNRNDLSLI
jgi:hypothetical protein